MILQESGEMYLESIYVLLKENEHVRSIDLAEHMGFSKPSVSRAVGILKSGGFLSVDENGHLILTDIGLTAAKKIYERHKIITDLLIRLGVDSETAAADACKIEHVISDASFEAVKRHMGETNKNDN